MKIKSSKKRYSAQCFHMVANQSLQEWLSGKVVMTFQEKKVITVIIIIIIIIMT